MFVLVLLWAPGGLIGGARSAATLFTRQRLRMTRASSNPADAASGVGDQALDERAVRR
jgi:hypothetical protein